MKRIQHLSHFAKGAILVAGAAAPVLMGSPAARSFLERHPQDAAYMPVIAGLAVVVYKWAKGSP